MVVAGLQAEEASHVLQRGDHALYTQSPKEAPDEVLHDCHKLCSGCVGSGLSILLEEYEERGNVWHTCDLSSLEFFVVNSDLKVKSGCNKLKLIKASMV